MVVVHTDVTPTDEDWDKVMSMILEHGKDTKNLLVYSTEAGPTAAQRSRFADTLRKIGDLQTIVMTNSRLVRGSITAFGWIMSGKVKAVSTTDFDGIMPIFGFDPASDEAMKIRVTLKHLARSASQSVDAFADESGRFRKKYGE
jgi:hypothetical protein